ncbi:MAG: DNA polymerase I [Candidatus Moranbacteria bacterium]|nr:DNA polymerase I [Candidatus Moranbacteria bacterium]
MKRKKIILIDGNAIIHRSYHAIPPLTTKKGELVNAVYGFASTLLAVIEKFHPEYVAASFDLAGPTFRHEKFKDYKATRVKAPDDLYQQIDRVKELVRAFNIPIFEREGFEADDVIGTIAQHISCNMEHETKSPEKDDECKKLESKSSKELKDLKSLRQLADSNLKTGLDVIIVTGDLDALQLVNEDVSVYTMSRGISKAVLYDQDAVFERYGLSPEQLKDFKGLRGDASDNIPGVKGIGEKGAINLLKEYETLEGIYEHIDELKGAVKKKLEDGKEMAFLSKELGTIKTDIELDLKLDECATHDFDREKVTSLFRELNFHSLLKRLPGNSDLRKRDEAEMEKRKEIQCELLTEDGLKRFFDEMSKQKEVAFDLSCVGENVKALSFFWGEKKAYFVEIDDDSLEYIKEFFEKSSVKKIGFELKDAMRKMEEGLGVKMNLNVWDTKLASYLLNPGGKIDFGKVALEELGEEFEKDNGGQLSLGMEGIEEISQKGCKKVKIIFDLKQRLNEKLEEISNDQKKGKTILDVFEKIEMPLTRVLLNMERNGIRLNVSLMNEMSKKIGGELSNLEKEICDIAGRQFNINSPKQLTEILFDEMKISTEGIKKTKTGISTAASELEKLRGRHDIIASIERYREAFKLKSTYIDALPKAVDKNSRIHTTFNQAVTATGRLSSENPNLQNIPIRTVEGKMIRTAFESEDGWVFVAADYSQIELRVMAHISGDKKLIEAFEKGEDIHKKTAAEINKVSLDEVTDKMRSEAKALNFGVIYGMGSYGFSQSAGIDQKEAKKYIEKYMENFPGVAAYIENTKEFARKNEFVETKTGRRRYLPEINSSNFMVKGTAERMAVNMPAQGFAADIMKMAMLAIHKEFALNSDVKIILQIHDEIILEVKKELAEKVSHKLKEIMENTYKLNVPLVVDTEIGKNWGEV